MSESPPLCVWSSVKYLTLPKAPYLNEIIFAIASLMLTCHLNLPVSQNSLISKEVKVFSLSSSWRQGQHLDRNPQASYVCQQLCCLLARAHCLLPISPSASAQPSFNLVSGLLQWLLWGLCASNTVILRQLFCFQGHLAIPGDIFGCPDCWGTTR